MLQEFDITILDKPGKDNVVVDFLSRLTIGENCTPIEDSFPDEYLFTISTHSLLMQENSHTIYPLEKKIISYNIVLLTLG